MCAIHILSFLRFTFGIIARTPINNRVIWECRCPHCSDVYANAILTDHFWDTLIIFGNGVNHVYYNRFLFWVQSRGCVNMIVCVIRIHFFIHSTFVSRSLRNFSALIAPPAPVARTRKKIKNPQLIQFEGIRSKSKRKLRINILTQDRAATKKFKSIGWWLLSFIVSPFKIPKAKQTTTGFPCNGQF